jgi:hypothetical protein
MIIPGRPPRRWALAASTGTDTDFTAKLINVYPPSDSLPQVVYALITRWVFPWVLPQSKNQ